jgi:hypothetical protein
VPYISGKELDVLEFSQQIAEFDNYFENPDLGIACGNARILLKKF